MTLGVYAKATSEGDQAAAEALGHHFFEGEPMASGMARAMDAP
jgi:hypothetical protein